MLGRALVATPPIFPASTLRTSFQDHCNVRRRAWITCAVLPWFLYNACAVPVTTPAHHGVAPAEGYETLTITRTGNVTRVLINNPPVNLMDGKMITDFQKLLVGLETDQHRPKVVIFSSADPVFFISHLDLLGLSATQSPAAPYNASYLIEAYTNVTNLLTTVPSIFIGEVSGKATASGDEILVRMDMRFASEGAQLGAPRPRSVSFTGLVCNTSYESSDQVLQPSISYPRLTQTQSVRPRSVG